MAIKKYSLFAQNLKKLSSYILTAALKKIAGLEHLTEEQASELINELEKYAGMIASKYKIHEEAHALINEAMIKVFRNPTYEELPIDQLIPLMKTTIKNLVLDQLRQQKPEISLSQEDKDFELPDRPQDHSNIETVADFKSMIEDFPPVLRDVLGTLSDKAIVLLLAHMRSSRRENVSLKEALENIASPEIFITPEGKPLEDVSLRTKLFKLGKRIKELIKQKITLASPEEKLEIAEQLEAFSPVFRKAFPEISEILNPPEGFEKVDPGVEVDEVDLGSNSGLPPVMSSKKRLLQARLKFKKK